MDKLRLFPNHASFFDGSKYSEFTAVPIYVPDPVDPNIVQKLHYPKELVYADNIDRSMEEIKASLYLERYVTCVIQSSFFIYRIKRRCYIYYYNYIFHYTRKE